MRSVRWLFVCSLALFVASVAHADRATSEEAQRAYQRGLKHYNLSQWQPALEAFQAAYFARPDPALLFNIGQCQRQLADYRNAANSFRAFLREQPNIGATQRAQVEALLIQMEQALQEARANQPPQGVVSPAPEPSATATTAAPAPATTTTTPAAEQTPTTSDAPVVGKRPLYKKWWLWTAVGGVLVVGVAVGVGVGLTASRDHYVAAPGAVSTVEF